MFLTSHVVVVHVNILLPWWTHVINKAVMLNSSLVVMFLEHMLISYISENLKAC